MPTYVTLFNWTEQGVKAYKESASRYEAFTEQARRYGVKVRDIYWTAGPYDIVTIFDAPDGESMSACLLDLASAGNLRTTSMRGYSVDEFKGILAKTG